MKATVLKVQNTMTAHPTLETWLGWPREQVAECVREAHLSIKIALDGTTRHYLLADAEAVGRPIDFEAYARHGARITLQLLDRLFSCGLETVLVLNVWPADIVRRAEHLQKVVGYSRQFVLGTEAIESYARWQVRARLYGNFDISPVLAGVRPQLTALDLELAKCTSGQRLLLWGYSGGNALDEIIMRSVQLSASLGRPPSENEVRRACFPHGPETLDLYIGSGWLRIGNADLPPALNGGRTDVYSLSVLPFDLSEHQLRTILYDRLFRRAVLAATDEAGYEDLSLAALRSFYEQHKQTVLGIGQLVGPGFWYPAES